MQEGDHGDFFASNVVVWLAYIATNSYHNAELVVAELRPRLVMMEAFSIHLLFDTPDLDDRQVCLAGSCTAQIYI